MAGKPLRGSVEIPIQDDELSIDINWRVIEQVERVFGVLADLVASEVLVRNPTRHKVAEVIALWCSGHGMRRRDIIEEVMTADADDLQRYIGAIQGAVLYVLRHIDRDQMRKLAAGEDLDDGDDEEGEDDDSKKKAVATPAEKPSADSATE